MLPQYWIDFLDDHDLRGKICHIGEVDDESGVTVDMRLYNEDQSVDESTNYYPGVVVTQDGYIPVGDCMMGSGDPYFIKLDDGPKGCLYRIYHDAVSERGYKVEEAVAVVLRNYEFLIKYVAP